MNALTQNKVKTITVYSRQEIISFFKEFKQKINKAYQNEDNLSVSELLNILKLTLVLDNVTNFIDELNTVGDIQVTSYLQALFVKNSMWTNLQTYQNVKNITLQLIRMFQDFIKTYKMPPKFSQIQYNKNDFHFSFVFCESLTSSYQSKDIEFLMLCVDWFKVKIITEIHLNKLKQFQFFTQNKQGKALGKQWIEIIKILVKYCRIIQSLKKQQTAISICYWLCTNEKLFIKECVNEGIINILKRSLVNKNITESYGLKIINFLKLLLSQESDTNQFSEVDFQHSIVKFSRWLNNEKSLKQIRQLMNLNEVKNKLTHKQKLQVFKDLSENPRQNENQLVQNVHLLGLYAQSQRISDFIFSSESDNFSALIQNNSLSVDILKEIFSALSYIFSIQKGSIQLIKCSLDKITSLLQSKSQSITSVLKGDRKRVLIGFIRILKQLLHNKKYVNQISAILKQKNIIKLFSLYSDCTNFVYEKQLLQLKLTLNPTQGQSDQKQESNKIELVNALKKHMVLKQNSPIKKLPGEDQLAQIKLLYQLVQQNPKQANITSEILKIVSNKMYVEIQPQKNQNLSIFQTQDCLKINQIKTQINFYSLKLFLELFKDNQTGKLINNQEILMKIIKIGMNTDDLNIFDNVVFFVIQYCKNFQISQNAKKQIQQLWKKAIEISKHSNNSEFLEVLRKISPKSKDIQKSSQQIMINYVQKLTTKAIIPENIEMQFLTLIKTIQIAKILQFLKLLSQQQPSRENLPNYLKILWELSKNYELKLTIFKLFSIKLKTFYAQQIQTPSQQPQKIKDLIYLTLKELVSVNIASNEKYFQQFLKITLMKQYNPVITKQQLIWIEQALAQFKDISSLYTFTEDRRKDLFEFVESCPEMIGIECALILEHEKQISQQFMKRHGENLVLNIEKQNISEQNLNFFLFYSENCHNQIFQSYSFINIIDKGFIAIKKYFLSFKSQQQSINFKNQEKQRKNHDLSLIQKKSKIICNFICNQNLILNENECQHCVREIIEILTFLSENFGLFQKICENEDNRLILVRTFLNLLKSLIQIGKNQLRSKQLSQFQQKQCCRLIQQLIFLKDKDINESLSQLLRLIILKDRERKYFKLQKEEAFDKSYHQLSKINTEKGVDHLNVCKTILSWGQTVNKKDMNKMIADYFLIQIEEQPPTQQQNLEVNRKSVNRVSRKSFLNENGEIPDSELMRHLKALLNPPYSYGINIISKYLRPLKSKQYVDTVLDIFVMSSSLYQEDIENKSLNLNELRKFLTDTVSQDYCELNERFYTVINMNKEGASLALKRKNIGKKGIEIICQKMIQNKQNDDVLIYAEILTVNALTLQEMSIIHDYKIPTIVNNVYRKKSLRPQYCQKLGNFIGHTSKLQQNQQQYAVNEDIIENLTAFKNNSNCISATLNAIAGLVYSNAKNQRQFGKKQNLQKVVNYCTNQNSPQLIIEKGFNVLANLAYKNKTIWRTYFDLQIDRKTMKMLTYFSARDAQSFFCIKQILRLLGIIALTSEGGFKLTTMRYLSFGEQLFDTYLIKRQFSMINQIIGVVFNITNQTQNDNRVTIKKLDEQKVVDFILKVAKQCTLNGPIIECCLQTLQNLLNYEFILQHSVNKQLLQLMQRISQTQETNQTVFVKWFRLMYLIYKNDKKIVEISLSNILYSATNFMRVIDFVEDKILQINMSLILKIKESLNVNDIVRCGWIEFLIINLKAKNHTSANLSKILDILIELTQKNLLTPFACTKLFEILIKRLQLQYKDQNARKLILLLKRIKQKTTITTESSIFLLEFSCFFLTQKEIILSPRYHRRVRQIISVLAYFISFNIELKIVFRDPNLASILRDWIKVDTLIEDESSISESCRLLLFAIYNDQSTLKSVREDDIFGQQKARDELQKGLKCTLYRRDGSNKNAMIKLKKETNQIMAYKLPNGEIKTKYSIPLNSILVLRSQYQEDQDLLYNDTVFPKDKGLFAKKPKSELLTTIIGMVGEDLSIRQINVEFSKQEKKNTFVNYLRLIITAETQKKLKS